LSFLKEEGHCSGAIVHKAMIKGRFNNYHLVGKLPICKECGQYVPEGKVCDHPYLIMKCNKCGEESKVPLDMPMVSHMVICGICGEEGNFTFEKPIEDLRGKERRGGSDNT